jgi:hypothetical protein
MNLHEYQSKEILSKYGVAIQRGIVANNVDEAVAAAEKLTADTGAQAWVVKAQIHAGGRGKGAGVVYPVDSKYVNALIKRSRAAKVDKEFASAVEFFDLYGLDISNTLRKKTSKFFDTIHAYNVSSGLTSRAYVSGETTYKELPSPVKILISLSCSGSFSTVSAMLVCADKNTAYHSDLIPRVQQICKKFVAYLATKYDVQAERFSAVKSKLANVALPDGSSVSGYSYMYGAKVRIL